MAIPDSFKRFLNDSQEYKDYKEDRSKMASNFIRISQTVFTENKDNDPTQPKNQKALDSFYKEYILGKPGKAPKMVFDQALKAEIAGQKVGTYSRATLNKAIEEANKYNLLEENQRRFTPMAESQKKANVLGQKRGAEPGVTPKIASQNQEPEKPEKKSWWKRGRG